MLIFLIGPAAAGKTTVAKHITSCYSGFNHVSDLTDLNKQVKGSELGNEDQRVVRLPHGGFKIFDPVVWDEALKSVAFSHRSTPNLVFEFSRGLDQAYLTLHGIKSNEVYDPSFQILADVFSSRINREAIVIVVDAPFEIRDRRNSGRRLAGEHSVDPSEFRRLFRSQLFSWDHQKERYLIPATTTALPVTYLDNTRTPFDPVKFPLPLKGRA